MITTWEIWDSEDEGEVRMSQPGPDPVDNDGKPLTRVHRFWVEGYMDDKGTPEALKTIRRAFDYANKWRWDEGEWPEGTGPIDQNKGQP